MGNNSKRSENGLEFNEEEYDEIDRYCKEVGIIWFASAWDIKSQEFLNKYKHPVNKIASAMATNLEFVDFVASEQKPTFASTECVLLKKLIH